MSSSEMREEFVALTKKFVDGRVIPVAQQLEADNEYPEALIKEMKEMGLFGMLIPEEFGGFDVDLGTYWRVIRELSRGWMSLGGALNSHLMTAYLVNRYGTDDQRSKYLPAMATGDVRACMAMTEPEAGTDVAAIRTVARPDGDNYVINGSKMFITNGEKSDLICVLLKTDPKAQPVHRGMSVILVDKDTAGVGVGKKIHKLGYNGIETVPLDFEDVTVPSSAVLGGETGRGFYHAMSGGEIGRLNVAARALGLSDAAIDEATKYALNRETFGKAIAEHQAIQLLIADMLTRTNASVGLLDTAAEKLESGARADMEVGMAKLFATESAVQTTLDSMRVHGGYGYTKEFIVERLFRDAPQMVIAEGTSEIQRTIIARSHFSSARKDV